MQIDEKLINHIATLSRLEFTQETKQNFIGQLNQILQYVEKLKGIDISKIQPLVHTQEQHNIFRADKNKPSLEREKALTNAPDKEKGFFKVPRVIE